MRARFLIALLLAGDYCGAVHAQTPAPASGQAAGEAGEDAEAKAHAKALFEIGVSAYDAGHYEEALSSFQEAFRIRPHPLVRVNIANCYDKLGKPLEALFHFEQFTAANVGSPEQRKEVAAAIERLRKQVGQVLVRVTPDGALVTIDHGEQRRTPIVDAVSLNAGKHEIEVKLEGYQPLQRSIDVQGGTTQELNLVLSRAGDTAAAVAAPTPTPVDPSTIAPLPEEPEKAGPAPGAEPAPPAEAGKGEPAAGESSAGIPAGVWIVGGVSAALLLAGSVTGLLALDAESDFDQAVRAKLDPNATSIERLNSYQQALDASDRADALALTTDLLLLGALAGAAVTTVLAINAGDDEEPKTAFAPAITPHAWGAQVTGRF